MSGRTIRPQLDAPKRSCGAPSERPRGATPMDASLASSVSAPDVEAFADEFAGLDQMREVIADLAGCVRS